MATRPDLAALLAQFVEALTEQDSTPAIPEPRPAPERVLLTVEEAAEQLGIGRTTMFALIREGAVESVQIGRLRRVPVTAVQAYAARLVAEAGT
jgi:excisionase family DNA binding protein